MFFARLSKKNLQISEPALHVNMSNVNCKDQTLTLHAFSSSCGASQPRPELGVGSYSELSKHPRVSLSVYLSLLVTTPDLRQFCEVVKHGEFQGFLARTFMQLIVQVSNLCALYHFVSWNHYQAPLEHLEPCFAPLLLCSWQTASPRSDPPAKSLRVGLIMPWESRLAPAKPKTTVLIHTDHTSSCRGLLCVRK